MKTWTVYLVITWSPNNEGYRTITSAQPAVYDPGGGGGPKV